MTAWTKEQTPTVGSTVLFGHYPQTAEGMNNTPIEWQVLDVQGGKALLLRYNEANSYLRVEYRISDHAKARVQPTSYARAKSASVNNCCLTSGGAAAGYWWLRSPGTYDCAALVYCDGSLGCINANTKNVCVRPAIWVDVPARVF